MSVPMVDLKIQYEAIKEEINNAVLGVIRARISFWALTARRSRRQWRPIME